MDSSEQTSSLPHDVPPLYPSSSVAARPHAQTAKDIDLLATLFDPSAGKHTGGAAVKQQLQTIHDELEQLRLRRQQLEEKRIRLLAASLPPGRHASKREERSVCSISETSARARERGRASGEASSLLRDSSMVTKSHNHHASGSRTSSTTRRHPFPASTLSHRSGTDVAIPSENARRQNLQDAPYFQLKEAMKKAAEEDTMCMIGSFLLEDNSKVYTFGRERRFRPVVGQNGKYYLSTDVEASQSANQRQQRSRSAGFVRPAYSGTPGPGAYTPRYGKTSKPSILASYL